jgi:hypothetical protein
MTNPSSKRTARLLILLLGSACLYFYWSRVPQNIDAMSPPVTQKSHPLTDLYPRWYGTRELLLHHRDPYGTAVTGEIQLAYGGKEQRFAYPLYVILFVAPTIGMQFHTAQTVFWWFLAVAAVLGVALWLSVLDLPLSVSDRVALFVTVFFSVPVLQGLSLLQLGLLVATLLGGAAAAAYSGHLLLAGMLLALATIKPPLSLLAACWFGLWVTGDWRHRRPLLWGFAATMAVLILATEALVPGWLFRYPSVIAAYARYTDSSPLISVFSPSSFRWPITVASIVAAALFCWRVRRQPATSIHFIFALAFVLTLTVMIIPTALPPYNHLLLLPGILLILRYWTDLWSRNFASRVLTSLFLGVAALPWLLAPIVSLGLFFSARAFSMRLVLVPLYASLGLPFAVLGLLFLLRRARPLISSTSGATGSAFPASTNSGTRH